MRVVLDTNVIVSALQYPQRVPAQVLERVRSGALTVLYNGRILDEYAGVLTRPKFAFDKAMIARFFVDVASNGELVRSAAAPFKLPDQKDQVFLDVAVAGGADAIVTGNLKDFPAGCGVRILKPAVLIEQLAG